MRLIVGLGNPGEEYAQTRHNLGYWVVDLLAQRWQVRLGREEFAGLSGRGQIAGVACVLLKPTTMMNCSGVSVEAARRFYGLEMSELLVVADDLDLPVGRIRIRPGGSAGGHKGLADIAARLGSEGFARLRVGIGRDEQMDPVCYVLSPFSQAELAVVRRAVGRAAEAVECWLREGLERAMNRYNVAEQLGGGEANCGSDEQETKR